MNETTKTKKLWGNHENSILAGRGIDIGCGPDPVAENARRFDMEHGDANYISKYVDDQFDYVYASHCLEHMHQPGSALLEWWKLVRVGGHLIFLVPDEDLYEQGVFPSRFNPDHKATFTISKQRSWSPVSVNVLDLALSLPGGKLVSLMLQDQGYDRRLMRHGPIEPTPMVRRVLRVYNAFKRRTKRDIGDFERLGEGYSTFDQTQSPDAVAQIQCIIQKVA